VEVTLQRDDSIGLDGNEIVYVTSQGPRAKKLSPIIVSVDAGAAEAGEMRVIKGVCTVETRKTAGDA
jgi:hypothetical protein